MLRVGITGGIGSGKSTVTRLLHDGLAAAGVAVIVVDTDLIAREVVEPDGAAFPQLVERFGSAIVAPDGRLDRQALADIVFNDDDARLALRTITHPAISAVMMARVEATPPEGVCLMDVPLLVEDPTRAERNYDVIVVVGAPVDVRLDRLEARGLRREDAAARMAAQASDEERNAFATHLVDNGGGVADLERAVAALVPLIVPRR